MPFLFNAQLLKTNILLLHFQRDLKPVNIFLDSRDQVKIGDFGLATTSFLALQQNHDINMSHNRADIGSSHTGKVGTALYVSPELMGKASNSKYNQKVDLYSLGIIFFEMCHRPFSTGMERVETLAALRSPKIQLPAWMENDVNYSQQVKVCFVFDAIKSILFEKNCVHTLWLCINNCL